MEFGKRFSNVVHLLAICNFAYAIHYQVYRINMPLSAPRYQFGGQWKYLTFWNLWIQLAYFIISLLNNLVGSHAKDYFKASRIQKVRDFFFATVAFPIGVFVAVMFWSIWAVDRELVFPLALDKYIPNYVNHMLHTTVLPFQLLELILLYHIYPRMSIGMGTTAFFCFTYLSWVLVIAHYGNIWVYPIFEVLPPFYRYVFMLICSFLGGLFSLFGKFINQLAWSASVTSADGTTQAKKVGPKAKKGQKTRLD